MTASALNAKSSASGLPTCTLHREHDTRPATEQAPAYFSSFCNLSWGIFAALDGPDDIVLRIGESPPHGTTNMAVQITHEDAHCARVLNPEQALALRSG